MPTELDSPPTGTTEVLTPADTPDLEGMKRADVPAIWDEFKTKAEKLKQTAETLVVTDVSQISEMKLARATRLALREVRLAMLDKHRELKETALRTCQKLDKGKQELLKLIEPLELRLKEQEEFAEREAVRIEDEKRTARSIEVAPFLSVGMAIDLGKMSDVDYAKVLADLRGAWEAKVERERKEKEAEVARLQAETEERERIRLEIERLKKEAEEREAAALKERAEAAERERVAAEKARKEREEADAEIARLAKQAEDERKATEAKAEDARLAAAATLAKEREEAVRLAREAQARAGFEAAKQRRATQEAAGRAAEKYRKEKEAIEAKAKTEREAREKLEADIAAKKAADERAATEARQAAEKAAAAPDKEKLMALSNTLLSLPFPALETPTARRLAVGVRDTVYSIADELAKDARLL